MVVLSFSVRLNIFLMKTYATNWRPLMSMYRKYLTVNTKKSARFGSVKLLSDPWRKYYNHQRYVNVMRMAPTSRNVRRINTSNKISIHSYTTTRYRTIAWQWFFFSLQFLVLPPHCVIQRLVAHGVELKCFYHYEIKKISQNFLRKGQFK